MTAVPGRAPSQGRSRKMFRHRKTSEAVDIQERHPVINREGDTLLSQVYEKLGTKEIILLHCIRQPSHDLPRTTG